MYGRVSGRVNGAHGVALILLLSDLHLSADNTSDVVADMKTQALPQGDQQTRLKLITSSLAALGEGLRGAGRSLDSVIISGDITVAGNLVGFELLPTVLESLGEPLPPSDRVLIVPGNHDITRFTEPSTLARYEHFMKLRDLGYRIAYLDGIDIDAQGIVVSNAEPPIVAAGDGSYLAVGMNSSNHCGSRLSTESELDAKLSSLEARATTDDEIRILLKSWNARGLADIARIDEPQLGAAHKALFDALVAMPAPLRIAVLHHQVQPVSIVEEVKPFDVMVNLGAFRDWIASNQIDVVLHGHKHEGRVLGDQHVLSGGSVSHEFLIVSAPTVQAGNNHLDPVGLLLEVEGPSPRTSGVRIAEIPTVGQGVQTNVDSLDWKHYAIDRPSQFGVVEGATIDDVHSKLMSMRKRLEDLPTPLVCRIQDGNSANVLPTTYPELPPSYGNGQEWFTRTIDWWQGADDLRSGDFTHGQRLRNFGVDEIDQVAQMVKALRDKPYTSRAVAILIDPTQDMEGPRRDFPAFALVQFLLRGTTLDVIAYFRKQEMPHWWPINVGELARLQQRVLQGLQGGSRFSLGAITTVTAMPVDGDSIPRVAVPQLDTRSEESGTLLDLVGPLFGTPDPVGDLLERWKVVFDDWQPPEVRPADGDRLPRVGLVVLADLVDEFAQALSVNARFTPLIAALRKLEQENSTYLGLDDQAAIDGRDRWRTVVDVGVKEILSVVGDLIA
jgi:3',5'-cyclic AMP phosphodiesterase CpdA